MRDIDNPKIGVVGAGSWGTALADLLAGKGYAVDLWAYEPEVARSINEDRENRLFLPEIILEKGLRASNDLAGVVSGKDMVLMVTPTHETRRVAGIAAPHIPDDAIVVSASKGIENQTLLTMTGVLGELLPGGDRLAAISGPSFAIEVAQKTPTVVTAAASRIDIANDVQAIFAAPHFRVYTNTDVIGVELGGAIKNVIAIASGIVDGLGLGLNTRAALITRGLAEIRRLGIRMGANPHTFAGLAGVGDLILTCTGTLSRNHTVGKMIGEGKKLDDILAEMRMVAEGVKTAKSVYSLSKSLNVEMPIADSVYAVLYDDLEPAAGVYQLMTRSLKGELDDVL